MNKDKYITINHLDEYEGPSFFKVGETLILKKDKNNPYDDEAISVHKETGPKCGYVANSVHTVARGTFSAGRMYDHIKDEAKCRINFILQEEDCLIAKLEEKSAEL